MIGRPLPSARGCSLVEKPPWLRPSASPTPSTVASPPDGAGPACTGGVLVSAHHRGVPEVQIPVEVAARIRLRLQALQNSVEHPLCASGRTGSTPCRQGRSAPAGPPRVRPCAGSSARRPGLGGEPLQAGPCAASAEAAAGQSAPTARQSVQSAASSSHGAGYPACEPLCRDVLGLGARLPGLEASPLGLEGVEHRGGPGSHPLAPEVEALPVDVVLECYGKRELALLDLLGLRERAAVNRMADPAPP